MWILHIKIYNKKFRVGNYQTNFPVIQLHKSLCFTADTKVVTKLDTPKLDYRERTGTEWLVLGLAWG